MVYSMLYALSPSLALSSRASCNIVTKLAAVQGSRCFLYGKLPPLALTRKPGGCEAPCVSQHRLLSWRGGICLEGLVLPDCPLWGTLQKALVHAPHKVAAKLFRRPKGACSHESFGFQRICTDTATEIRVTPPAVMARFPQKLSQSWHSQNVHTLQSGLATQASACLFWSHGYSFGTQGQRFTKACVVCSHISDNDSYVACRIGGLKPAKWASAEPGCKFGCNSCDDQH